MPNRRERKKQETRRKIFTAAMNLFQERGFAATTIDMIAEKADVARGTVFLHFPSKEAILAHWGQDLIDEIIERREEWDREDWSCENKIMQLFKIAIEVNQANIALVKILVRSTLANSDTMIQNRQQVSLRNLFADILEEGQEQGKIKSEIDPIIAGNMLENIYLHAMYDWVLAEGEWPIEEILAKKVHYLFGGLSSASECV
jgi:AcrR family transcriptional regulator